MRTRMAKLRRWLRENLSRAHLKQLAAKWARILLNPRLLLCVFIAWMITNGWSYLFFGLGMLWRINWMRIVGGAYMSFLWLPFTPEKIVTGFIALFLLRLLFPKDEKTLGALREWLPKRAASKKTAAARTPVSLKKGEVQKS